MTLSFQSQLELFLNPLQELSCAGTSKQLSLLYTQIPINTLERINCLNLNYSFCIPSSHEWTYLKPIDIDG